MLASLTAPQQAEAVAGITDDQCEELLWDWRFWARPKQLPPEGPWSTWLVLAGRGYGKTRVGAEWLREEICGPTPMAAGKRRRVAIVAETSADARDVCVEGESGLLSVHPKDFRPLYEPSKRRLTWPNGAVGSLYNATEPDQLRGPQHDAAWCDEAAKWKYGPDTWDMLQFGLRLGDDPRQVVTTTPKPCRVLRDIRALPGLAVTMGTSYENRGNLAPSFFDRIISKYEGTRLGRQELLAEELEEAEGALWSRDLIEECRVSRENVPHLQRIVVAIDPATTDNPDSDDTGICVAGLGSDGHGYVLDDLSGQYSPEGWARRAVNALHVNKADRIIGEANNGGDMIEHTLRTLRDDQDRPTGREVPYKKVHASRGKQARAEPVVALYEQHRVHHVGVLASLEDEQVTWEPGSGARSPSRLDAVVWALTELMVAGSFFYAAG